MNISKSWFLIFFLYLKPFVDKWWLNPIVLYNVTQDLVNVTQDLDLCSAKYHTHKMLKIYVANCKYSKTFKILIYNNNINFCVFKTSFWFWWWWSNDPKLLNQFHSASTNQFQIPTKTFIFENDIYMVEFTYHIKTGPSFQIDLTNWSKTHNHFFTFLLLNFFF